ncbi:putative calpain-like cysteine peptidase [Leishmania major strain Friedlin]|uniref:Putative calpain-like cysteine peptidase n=1 Tax=Leishmania major TaxID=5664 RepID=Q4QDT6_LEIMA|nr:putative calpain-like cysteine peptidase [Leishmania major strain Friedlin]CAG9572492.1 cysteine_peptidase_-_Clan_CA_-_family_C2_-_putative [Leishmania major strain Friedlin]CAJ03942.1 putative calpain-like cysteine peptidase [Leishmania major strain Friedlin]|eukprot:XP_001682512.1 putative calpain-like cysteine peptidase [Leishmania major strain Friedlin]
MHIKRNKNWEPMTVTREQSYISVCKELNDAPLRQLQETLKYGDTRLDVSGIYLPRKHFRCVLQFIEERPDIEELILDGANIGVEEVKLLKESLLRSCVSKLSLQRIKLDSASANIIRQLCIENSNLVSVVLRDTCIPSYLVDEIMLIVDLNRLNAESLSSTSTAGAQQKASAVARWMLFRGKNDRGFCATVKLSSSATRKVTDGFVTSYDSVFSDISFQQDAFDHPVAGMETIRWNKYYALHSFQEAGLGNSKAPFSPSPHYNNQNLCAALNILSFYDVLYKSLVVERYPEAGLYVFRLFVGESPVEVYVDDLVPCVHLDATCTIVGLNSCSSPFYAAVLEKAVAKAIGGYRYIQELSLSDCIELLTGCTGFEVNLLSRSSFSTTFDTLRALSEYGHKLVACAIPHTSIEEQTFEESGVCCGIPYAILETDACQKNGSHYAFLIQVAAPSSGRALKYAFEYEMYKTEEVNGNRVLWMTFEDFAATFERVFLLLWPFDDAVSDHKTTVEFQVTSEFLSSSSQFAKNPSFLIQNKGKSSSPIMVSLSTSSAPDTTIGAKCLFYKAANTENGAFLRRYNVCENNASFGLEVFEGNEGSVFFNLLPTERLQMTLSSRVPSNFRIRISSVENVDAMQLPDIMASSTFSAKWNTLFKAKRFSDDIFQLNRISGGCTLSLVLALSQATDSSPPFPLGVLGWKGTSIDVVDAAKPHFSTQQERSTVCVHSFLLTLAAGESFFLLPYCCGSRCPDGYDLTVFCKESFTQSRVKTASVLRCTKT